MASVTQLARPPTAEKLILLHGDVAEVFKKFGLSSLNLRLDF